MRKLVENELNLVGGATYTRTGWCIGFSWDLWNYHAYQIYAASSSSSRLNTVFNSLVKKHKSQMPTYYHSK